MKRTVILKLGSTFPRIAAMFGDFEDWIACRLGLLSEEVATGHAEGHGGPIRSHSGADLTNQQSVALRWSGGLSQPA